MLTDEGYVFVPLKGSARKNPFKLANLEADMHDPSGFPVNFYNPGRSNVMVNNVFTNHPSVEIE